MLCTKHYKPYTMPFARRVLSYFHTYVSPSSPRNYNALHRTISRRSFSLHPGGFRGVSSCVLAVRICTRCIRAMLRRCVDRGCWQYIYSGGLVFFSRPKRRTCGEWRKFVYLLRFPRNYINIFIYYAESSKICAFAICEQTDVWHANRRHGAACIFVPVHLTACNALRWCALRVAASGAHPSTQAGHPPRWGTRSRNAAILRIFFLFFLKSERTSHEGMG